MKANNSLIEELYYFFFPLITTLKVESEEETLRVFENIGLNLKDTIENIDKVTDDLNNLIELIRKFNNQRFDGNELEDLSKIFASIKAIIDGLIQFDKDLSFKPGYENYYKSFVQRFFEGLLQRYLHYRSPVIIALAESLGLIEWVNTGTPYTSYRKIHWNRIFVSIKNPLFPIQTRYNWGGENFRLDLLTSRLLDILFFYNFEFRSQFEPIDSEHEDGTKANLQFVEKIKIPLFKLLDHAEEIGMSIGSNFGQDPKGQSKIIFNLYNTGGKNALKVENENYLITFESNSGTNPSTGLLIEPGKFDIFGTDDFSELDWSVILERKKDQRPILWGSRNGLGLEIQNLGFSIDMMLLENKTLNFRTYLRLKNIIFHLKPPNNDGFLGSLLPPGGYQSKFSFEIGWSFKEGLLFGGSASLEKLIPLNQSLGPIYLESIKVGVDFQDTKIHPKIGVVSSVELGPLTLIINNIGTSLGVGFDTKFKGSLGFFDIDLPQIIGPNLIGLTLNSEVVNGGGFLAKQNNQYTGLLSLSFQSLDLTATGIIQTQLPNNQKGYALLLSINTIFTPPVQLSFGFTLKGVGGLIASNRAMKVGALREKILSGTAGFLLFPVNPITNVDRLLSEMEEVFPTQKNHFVIAPFFKIGYGTTSIIEADLGVLIELPFRGRAILLGVVDIYLPQKENPATEIHADIFGDLNFAAKYILVEGRLRNSRIKGVPLTGEFAFLLNWGERPAFLFSAGGFHPRYKRPVRFPEIPRLNAIIEIDKHVTLNSQLYQAITSNSFQVGLTADLVIKWKKITVSGFLGFDALFHFDPFRFDVGITAKVDVRYRGFKLIGFDLFINLLGPSPWVAAVNVTFKFARFIKVGFNKTFHWGEESLELPIFIKPVSILDQIKLAIERPHNWNTKLPPKFTTGEYLRSANEITKEGLVMHPSGYLEFRQSVVPFKHNIDKFGNANVQASISFEIKNIFIGSEEYEEYVYLKNYFAVGQYHHLSDAEKLSADDFEEWNGGLSFGLEDSKAFDFGTSYEHSEQNKYENIIITSEHNTLRKQEAEKVLEYTVNTLSQKQIISRSLNLKWYFKIRGNRYSMIDTTPRIDDRNIYTIADIYQLDPKLYDETKEFTIGFESYVEAKQLLNRDFKKQKQELQVVPISAVKLSKPIKLWRTIK